MLFKQMKQGGIISEIMGSLSGCVFQAASKGSLKQRRLFRDLKFLFSLFSPLFKLSANRKTLSDIGDEIASFFS